MVVILTAFANLATLSAMVSGQAGSRPYAQTQVAEILAQYRQSTSPVRALARTRLDWQLYSVVFRVVRRLGPIGFFTDIPVFWLFF